MARYELVYFIVLFPAFSFLQGLFKLLTVWHLRNNQFKIQKACKTSINLWIYSKILKTLIVKDNSNIRFI